MSQTQSGFGASVEFQQALQIFLLHLRRQGIAELAADFIENFSARWMSISPGILTLFPEARAIGA